MLQAENAQDLLHIFFKYVHDGATRRSDYSFDSYYQGAAKQETI